MSREPLAALAAALGFEGPPEPVLAAVREVYAELDLRLREGAEGLELPCRRGCDACCHEAVFLSAPELLLVAAELFTWPAPERARVVDTMLEIAARFEDELELLEVLEPGPERDEVAARVKFTCPLLDPGGGCRVYAARELNGRTFGVSVDERSGQPYGCELTHARLAVLPPARTARLAGARAARGALVERVPNTARVHVYPWWFSRFERWIRAAKG